MSAPSLRVRRAQRAERAFGSGGIGTSGASWARLRRGRGFREDRRRRSGRLRRGGARRVNVVQRGAGAGAAVGGAGHVVIGDEVRAGAPRRGAPGRGIPELAGCVERVRAFIPPRDSALAEDQVATLLLPLADAADRASICERTAPVLIAFWRRPLRVGGDEMSPRRRGPGPSAMESADSLIAVGCLVGKFGGTTSSTMMTSAGMAGARIRRRRRSPRGARARRLEDGYGVGEQRGGFLGVAGQAVEARCPGRVPCLSSGRFRRERPRSSQAARVPILSASFRRSARCRAGEQGVPAQEQHPAQFGVLERPQVDGCGIDRRTARARGIALVPRVPCRALCSSHRSALSSRVG